MAKKSTKNKAIENALNSTLNNAEIKSAIEDAMRNELLDVFKEYGTKAIKETVYDVYQPKLYPRRYNGTVIRANNSGLLNTDNWVISSNSMKNMCMYVTNETLPNPYTADRKTGELTVAGVTTDKDLTYLIVNGYGAYPRYDWPVAGENYMEPRDFISATANKVNYHNFEKHAAIASGLMRHGFTVDVKKR